MISAMRSPEEIQVTFQFVGDEIKPEKITSMIDLKPSIAHMKGEIVEKHPKQVYPTGYWGLNSSLPPDNSLDEHLENLLDILEPKSSSIKKLRDIGFAPIFYCGCFTVDTTVSFKLKVDILQRIATIGASLEYSVYCCDEDN